MQVKPLLLELRIRNNRLRQLVCANGRTIRAFAQSIGLSPTTAYAYIALSKPPMTPSGEWKSTATRIAEALKVPPEWLWSEDVQAVRQSTVRREIDAAEMLAFAAPAEQRRFLDDGMGDAEEKSAALYAALEKLDERERLAIKLYWGIGGGEPMTYEEIGARLEVCRERVREIVAKGLRKLRSPRGVSSSLRELGSGPYLARLEDLSD